MKFYPIALLVLLVGFAVMSFNPVDKGMESESTMINIGLTDFKNKLDQLKTDTHQFSEDKISLEQLQESLKIQEILLKKSNFM